MIRSQLKVLTMKALRLRVSNWIIMALGASLATLSNHSYGEVVYRKLSALTIQPTSTEQLGIRPRRGVQVTRIAPQGEELTVILEGEEVSSLLPGSILESKRPKQLAAPGEPAWIATALLKVTEVREGYALAQVTSDGSRDSMMHFPDDPGLRVGDAALPQQLAITQKLRVLPTKTLTYDRLFIDPKSLPTTFELSPDGKEHLLDEARVFADVHAPLLLVEAHTDPHGKREANQIESYQRALTIRQILIDELGFDPERIVAVGLGESEPLDEPYLPGRAEQARRIVLRVKTPAVLP
jgi:hypothetical protein